MRDEAYDLVYILKPSHTNPDLRYSLRSVEKFCTFNKVWFIGFKPDWTTNVEFVPTEQNSTKWKNSTLNVLTACKTRDISNNFILMNDDFFALRPMHDWEHELNLSTGTIAFMIEKHRLEKRKSVWTEGFRYAQSLLNLLDCPYSYSFEAHLPMIINRQKFIEVFEHPLLQWFMCSEHVMLKRSLYRNLTMTENTPEPRIIRDVKLRQGEDLSRARLDSGWLSVFDGVTGNRDQYPKLNQYLYANFKNKSRYEL